MRRPAAVAVLALALVASACGDGGRKTPPLSIPDQVEGQVAGPDSLASPACRLAVGTGIGAEVVSVQTDLPASRVLAPGDVITEVDGVGVTESEDLIAVVRSLQVGDSVSVRVFRSGVDPFDAEVDLVEHSEESGAPMLGIGVRTAVELQDARSIEAGGALDSPLTAVVSVDGSLYAVDAVVGNWVSLHSATPEPAWVATAGSVYVLEDGEPDRLVSVTDPGSAVEFVAEGWNGRWVLGSQAGRVLVYADRIVEAALKGALFAVDPVSGAVEWFWSPRDSERTDNPLPIFAVSSPSQERTLVGTAQFDDEGTVEVLRFSLLDQEGNPLLVVPPANGALPDGAVVIGWHTDDEIAYQQQGTANILLWNVDDGDLRQIELPAATEDVQYLPIGDGTHFMVIGASSVDLIGGGESPSMRPLAVDCVADQVAPPGFVS
jgi:hypothetical protein